MDEFRRKSAKVFRSRKFVVFASLAILLLLIELGMRLLPVASGLRAVEVNDRHPIFSFTPNREYVWSKNWDFSIVNKGRVNEDGFVNDFDYDETVETPPLLAVIGDNFVVGAMVPYPETLHGKLARSLGDRGRVYSFAAGGAPLSQYLAYAEHAGQTYAPDAMVFVITNNTCNDNFLNESSKPGFHYFAEDHNREVALRRIDYRPSIIGQFLRQSALVRYLVINLNIRTRIAGWFHNWSSIDSRVEERPSTELIDAKKVEEMRRAIDTFLDQLPARSGVPVSRHLIILDGIRPHLYSRDELAAASGSYHDLGRRHFMRAARQRGYEIIDMQPIFLSEYEKDARRFEFATDEHWNGYGHSAAANAIASSETYGSTFWGGE